MEAVGDVGVDAEDVFQLQNLVRDDGGNAVVHQLHFI